MDFLYELYYDTRVRERQVYNRKQHVWTEDVSNAVLTKF
jgi:hypothetical protein